MDCVFPIVNAFTKSYFLVFEKLNIGQYRFGPYESNIFTVLKRNASFGEVTVIIQFIGV